MKSGTKDKIKLTKSGVIHIGKTLLELRKANKIKESENIQYNFILGLCKIWTGHKKYEKKAIQMANEIYCLIDYFYRNKSGGGDELVNYYAEPEPEPEPDFEPEDVSETKYDWKRWVAIGRLMLSVYYIISYATRSMELIEDNKQGILQIQSIVGEELKSEAGLAIMDVFDEKLEEAHLTSSNPVLQGAIQDTHKAMNEKYYLSGGAHAIVNPSASGIEFLDNVFTEQQFQLSPLPVLCNSFVDCLYDLVKISVVSGLKSAGLSEYITEDIEKEYKQNVKELKSTIDDLSGNMASKFSLSVKEFRGEYPEFNSLMVRLEEPSYEYLKQSLTNIVYGYPTGWHQLSQLLGIIEEIPHEVASKLLEVVKKKTTKSLIVSKRMMTNTIELIDNSKQILTQLFILAGCIYILKPKKKPRDTHLLYLEDAQKKKKRKRKKTKRKKKRSKKKSKKSKKNLRRK